MRRVELLRAERGTLTRRARREVVLCYPNTYRVAGASLGLQVLYRLLNSREGVSCQRAVLPEDAFAGPSPDRLVSIEHGMALDAFGAVLFSIAYELDIPHVAAMLQMGGLAPLARDRLPEDPPVIAGGPLTQSNALPLGPFVDIVVIGEAEEVVGRLLDCFDAGVGRAELTRLAAAWPGFWVPSVHGDALPDALAARAEHVPALGQWFSPHAEFKDMALIETARGCPRYCKFCVVRAPVSPMRSPPLSRVVDELDRGIYAEAPRIGFVGAAVGDWPPIADALAAAIERGKGVGISSLRADRLDEALVGLLRRGGYRTLTVASDAPSQRMRGKMMKGLRERHLIGAAELARAAGMKALKLYVILGLPEEEDRDLLELIALGRRLSERIRTAITVSPFVPKLHTPLARAPFEPIAVQMKKLRRVQRALGGRVDVRFDSPRHAWVEYRLSQGGQEAGEAAWEAFVAGGRHADWRRAFARMDARDPGAERAAAAAAERHGLWPLSGAR